MGLIGSLLHIIFARLIPLLVLLLAIFIGWLNMEPSAPEARFFVTLIPLLKGYMPPSIVGHGKMKGTPEVPDDMMPGPRPEGELFLELPAGAMMPQNGLGMCCRPTAYDDVLVERSVLWYLLLEGRHIDGAHLYLNHAAIGKGINEAIRRGVPREEIFFTTKLYPAHFGYNSTKALVPTFLEETGLEYIDLLLMHGPVRLSKLFLAKECKQWGLTSNQCRQETWKALSELREQGVIRNAGVSNFATHHLQDILALDGVAPIANNQIQWNPWTPQEWVDTVAFCREHGISITGYNSLGGSFQHHEAHTIDVLTKLAEKHNRTVAQIMLRWAIQTPAAVIPGTGNPNYMKENLSIYQFELSDEEMMSIEALRTGADAKKFFSMKPTKD